MLRFEKHILRGLRYYAISAQTHLSLIQNTSFQFVNRQKGKTKEERAVHMTLKDFETMEKKMEIQKQKRMQRKGITEEEKEDPKRRAIVESIFKKLQENPKQLDDDLIIDPKTGLIGRKDAIGDLETFYQSEEWKEVLNYKEDEIDKRLRREARQKEKEFNNDLLDEEASEIEEIEQLLEKTEKPKEKAKEKEKTQEKKNRDIKDNEAKEREKEPQEVKSFKEKLPKDVKPKRLEASSVKEDNEVVEKEDFELSDEEAGEAAGGRDVKRNENESRRGRTKKDRFQEVLKRFSSQSVISGENSKYSALSEEEDTTVNEEDDIFGELVQPEEDIIIKKDSKHDKNSRQLSKAQEIASSGDQKNPLNKNLQKFMTKLPEEKVKHIERRLEHEERIEQEGRLMRMGKYEELEGHGEEGPKDKKAMTQEYERFQKELARRKSLERFYKFLRKVEKDHLIKILSQSQLIEQNPIEQIPKFLVLLSFIRKHKILSNYNREDIFGILDGILKHVDDLRPTEISALAVLLDKMKIDKIEYFRAIEKYAIDNVEKLSIRSISNILFSFGRISTKQSILNDFSELFAKMENVIALKTEHMKPKDLAQIVVGYSKSQNFSQELLYVLEQACISKFDTLNGQELAVIAHSFSKNEHFSEVFFTNLREKLVRETEKFKTMELALVAEALESFKMLNADVFRILEKHFMLRSNQVNVQDIAVFFKILTMPEHKIEENTKKKMVEVLNILFQNIDANSLHKMFSNYAEKYKAGNIGSDVTEMFIRRLKILHKSQSIRGINLHEVKKELFKIEDEDIKRKTRKALD